MYVPKSKRDTAWRRHRYVEEGSKGGFMCDAEVRKDEAARLEPTMEMTLANGAKWRYYRAGVMGQESL